MTSTDKNIIASNQHASVVIAAGSVFIFILILFTCCHAYAANRTWSGSTSSVWSLAANWVGGNIPGNGDNVLIPGGLSNYPIVTANINIKNITVNSSGSGAVLTITNGNVDASKVTVAANGTMIISGGVINSTGTTVDGIFNMSGGTMYNSGTLVVAGTGLVNQSGGVIYMNGSAVGSVKDNVQIDAGGIFNQSGGTLDFKDLLPGAGTFNQTGSGAIVRVERNWQMGAGSTFNSTAGTIEYTGTATASNYSTGTRQFSNVIINAGENPGFSLTAGSTIPIRGNFTNNNIALSNTPNVTFIFNGNGNQSVYSAVTGTAATFGNVTVNKMAGVLAWQSNCSLSGDLTITAGSLDLVTYSANRLAVGGIFSIAAGGSLYLRGSTGGQTGSNFPLNFSTVNLAATSTVNYNGNNQTIAAFSYGNLTLSANAGAVVKTLPGTSLNVAGNLTSQQGSGTSLSFTAVNTLNIGGNFTIGINTGFIAGAYTHTLGGNLTASGTFNSTGNKLVFNGNVNQDIITAGVLNKVVVNKSSGMVRLTSDLVINDSLIFLQRLISTGTFKIISVTGVIANTGQSTGWVYGRLQKSVSAGSNISRTFEIGDSLVYTPVSMTLGTVTTAGTVVVQAIGTDHPMISNSVINPLRSVNRYWKFLNAGVVFGNGSFTFTWAASDPDVPSSPEFFKLGRYISTWDTIPSLISGAYSIQASGIAAFGEFAVGEVCDNSVIGLWTGNVNSDWFTLENWRCGMLPATTTDVKIPSGLSQYPQVNSGTAAARNVTIQPGASLTVNASMLQISGTILNNGTFNVSSGGIELNGNSLQSIPASLFTGNTIQNLTADNPAGVNVSGSLSISGNLKITQGVLNTGGSLTLLASATQTALIDGSGNGTLIGNITMQRYIPSGFGYKYISSPFQSAVVSELADEIDLTASFPSLYRYDEQRDVTGWVAYTNASGPLVPFTGYAANFGNTGLPVTMDISGNVSTGNQAISLFNNNKTFTMGFNLVGNPYPSPIDWDYLPGWNRMNIDDAIYFFDAGTSDEYGGVYSSYINGISSNGIAGNIIPSMQGFFVHVTDGAYPVAATLGINNTARTTDLQPVFHRKALNATQPMIRLSASMPANSFQDVLVVYFNPAAAEIYEKDKDALKLLNTDAGVPSFYSLTPEQMKLSINAVPESGYKLDLPLGIRTETAGIIHFSLKEISQIPAYVNIYFSDLSNRINYNLRSNPSVAIALDKGTVEGRFRLRLTENELPYITDIDEFGVYVSGEIIYLYVNVKPGETGQIQICSLTGQNVFEKEYTSGNYTINNSYGSGIYLVNFRSVNSAYSKKIFLQNE